jgi:hypothetical protein
MSTTRRKGTVQDQLVAEIFASGGDLEVGGVCRGVGFNKFLCWFQRN